MQEPNYHVPNDQPSSTFGIKLLCFFNLASVGLFGYAIIALLNCTRSECDVFNFMSLFIPSLLSSIILLLIGLYRFNRTPKRLRWITLGLPLLPMLGIYIAPFLG